MLAIEYQPYIKKQAAIAAVQQLNQEYLSKIVFEYITNLKSVEAHDLLIELYRIAIKSWPACADKGVRKEIHRYPNQGRKAIYRRGEDLERLLRGKWNMDAAWERWVRDVQRFYEFLDELEEKCGGKRVLKNCHGKMKWPKRGVYIFFELGEARNTTGDGLRVVRVGTHAIGKPENQQKLWDRLRTHRGPLSGKYANGGNHRASIFRKHVGYAIIARDKYGRDTAAKWGQGDSAPEFVRRIEHPIELVVSHHIRMMPFLWFQINDVPGPDSLRGYIERNAIALLSNYFNLSNQIDASSKNWLGKWAKSDFVKRSGMWNVDHVNESYDPNFLQVIADIIHSS
jgi:hypothetical protein